MLDDTLSALYEGSKPLCKQKSRRSVTRPGWNEYVYELHAEAREATKSWAMAGKPRHGPVSECERLTNARCKYAVRFICKSEQAMRAEATSTELLSNNVADFWKEVKVLNNAGEEIFGNK